MAKAKPAKFNNPGTPNASNPAPSAAPAPGRSEVKGSGTAKAAPPREISQDQIARRAFEIYASRGYAPGDQQADWLEAERQLKAGL